MAVSVSLEALVLIANSRPAWPEQFRGLIDKLEDDPDDRAQWAVIADWCDEHGECDLGEAFRWVAAHRGVMAEKRSDGMTPKYWMLKGLPEALLIGPDLDGGWDTLAGRAANLAERFRRLKEMLKSTLTGAELHGTQSQTG